MLTVLACDRRRARARRAIGYVAKNRNLMVCSARRCILYDIVARCRRARAWQCEVAPHHPRPWPGTHRVQGDARAQVTLNTTLLDHCWHHWRCDAPRGAHACTVIGAPSVWCVNTRGLVLYDAEHIYDGLLTYASSVTNVRTYSSKRCSDTRPGGGEGGLEGARVPVHLHRLPRSTPCG